MALASLCQYFWGIRTRDVQQENPWIAPQLPSQIRFHGQWQNTRKERQIVKLSACRHRCKCSDRFSLEIVVSRQPGAMSHRPLSPARVALIFINSHFTWNETYCDGHSFHATRFLIGVRQTKQGKATNRGEWSLFMIIWHVALHHQPTL